VTASWLGVEGAPNSSPMTEGPAGVWTLDVPVARNASFNWTATAVIGRATLTDKSAAASPCPPEG
jgi:hypothetical protein